MEANLYFFFQRSIRLIQMGDWKSFNVLLQSVLHAYKNWENLTDLIMVLMDDYNISHT